jgi:putative ABC transport system permease protein
VLGFLMSAALVALGGMLPLQDEIGRPTVSPAVAVSTILLLSAIAFLAGLFPARKAANMDPVECLRTGS